MKTPQQAAALEKAQAYKTPDLERRAQASRKLAELAIEAAIKRALEKAPPLSPAQVNRLGALLRGAK